MFYVYEWYVKQTNEIFYVGKGTGKRYLVRKHNKFFNDFIRRYDCESRIIKTFELEDDAFKYEHQRICELKAIGQCVCNIYDGGAGGTQSWWTEERRYEYSVKNVMKSEQQRKRMSLNNPMKDKKTVKKVANKLMRAVTIDGVIYDRLSDAANAYGVVEVTIRAWCRNGQTPDGKPCNYTDGKPVRTKRIINHSNKTRSGQKIIIDDKTFDYVKDAANYLGTTPSYLVNVIRHRNGVYKGHICKYDNQQPSQGNTDNSTLEGSTTNG